MLLAGPTFSKKAPATVWDFRCHPLCAGQSSCKICPVVGSQTLLAGPTTTLPTPPSPTNTYPSCAFCQSAGLPLHQGCHVSVPTRPVSEHGWIPILLPVRGWHRCLAGVSDDPQGRWQGWGVRCLVIGCVCSVCAQQHDQVRQYSLHAPTVRAASMFRDTTYGRSKPCDPCPLGHYRYVNV